MTLLSGQWKAAFAVCTCSFGVGFCGFVFFFPSFSRGLIAGFCLAALLFDGDFTPWFGNALAEKVSKKKTQKALQSCPPLPRLPHPHWFWGCGVKSATGACRVCGQELISLKGGNTRRGSGIAPTPAQSSPAQLPAGAWSWELPSLLPGGFCFLLGGNRRFMKRFMCIVSKIRTPVQVPPCPPLRGLYMLSV